MNTTKTTAEVRATASAPGKLILFGEHAVVHAQPAICASLSDLRMHVSASSRRDGVLEVNMPDIPDGDGDDAPCLKYVTRASSVRTVYVPESGANGSNIPSIPTEIDQGTIDEINTLMQLTGVKNDLACRALGPVIFLINEMVKELLHDDFGISITATSDGLPIGAGLGSSAAFSVALSAALFKLHNVHRVGTTADDNTGDATTKSTQHQWLGAPPTTPLSIINSYAYLAEVMTHGTPSGIDNTISCYGGAIFYQKSTTEGAKAVQKPIANFPPLDILLTNTGVPRSTKVLVSKVHAFKRLYPAVALGVLDAIGGIARMFHQVILDLNDPLIHPPESDMSSPKTSLPHDTVAHLMSINQHLLRILGVSHPSLERICTTTQLLGASSKLTGAGGGGCAVTYLGNLTLEQKEEVRREIMKADHLFTCFSSRVGGEGVLWTKDIPRPILKKNEKKQHEKQGQKMNPTQGNGQEESLPLETTNAPEITKDVTISKCSDITITLSQEKFIALACTAAVGAGIMMRFLQFRR